MKESNFQLVGKPQITKIKLDVNKDYIFEKEVTLEIDNNILVQKVLMSRKKNQLLY